MTRGEDAMRYTVYVAASRRSVTLGMASTLREGISRRDG